MPLLPKTKPSGAFLTMMKVKQRLTIRWPKRDGNQSKIKEQQWADFDLFNYLLSSSCVCFRADPPHPIWADPPHCLPIGVYNVQYFPIQLINITHCTIYNEDQSNATICANDFHWPLNIGHIFLLVLWEKIPVHTYLPMLASSPFAM